MLHVPEELLSCRRGTNPSGEECRDASINGARACGAVGAAVTSAVT
jgi:hypothetical protein